MGRYDFRPLRVHQTATRMLETKRLKVAPAWYSAIQAVTPAQPLVRGQPLRHEQSSRRSQIKKASKMFMPQVISYEEDHLRKRFFEDHPWELARPRTILENDGKDLDKVDYRRIEQPERALNGESVVQRQLWLLHNEPGISKDAAYDRARKEFYHHRLQEDTERRIAREEATMVGAQFGPTVTQIGMQLEDQQYSKWRTWAIEQAELAEQRQASMYTGSVGGDLADVPEEEAASIEEEPDSLPA